MPRDLLHYNTTFWVLWGLPTLLLLGGYMLPDLVRTVLWPTGLMVMSVGCLLNARGCGRTHCYVTSQMFFVAALYQLGSATGTIRAISPGLFLAVLFSSVVASFFLRRDSVCIVERNDHSELLLSPFNCPARTQGC
jgi:hypothetical protein